MLVHVWPTKCFSRFTIDRIDVGYVCVALPFQADGDGDVDVDGGNGEKEDADAEEEEKDGEVRIPMRFLVLCDTT